METVTDLNRREIKDNSALWLGIIILDYIANVYPHKIVRESMR